MVFFDDASKVIRVKERLNLFQHVEVDTFMHMQLMTFENIVAKGEFAHKEQYPLLSQSL